MNQRFENVIEPDHPVGHGGAADIAAVTLQDMFEAIQWQRIGILGDQDIGQQLNTGDTFSQRVSWPRGGLDVLFAIVFIEDGLFLPVFDYCC